MDLGLDGRTAVVTGASRGIGLATAQVLAGEGMRVIAVARGAAPELDGVARTVRADLADREGVAVLARELAGTDVDLLVNNLGGVDGNAHAEGFLAITDEDWQRSYDLNLFSAVRVTRVLLPGLLRRRGVIVNVSSIGARIAHPPYHYGTAKAALTNLTKALAEEFGDRGLRAVTVSPGPTRTGNWTDPAGMAGDLAREAGLDLDTFLEDLPGRMGITTGRLAEPAEIGATVAFLASPHAANITGIDVVVDGGVIKTV